MMDINTGFLATGGIVALLAAGWRQAKNLFQYVSSAIIISASFDDKLGQIVIEYLETHYKTLPSGNFNFSAIFFSFRDKEYGNWYLFCLRLILT